MTTTDDRPTPARRSGPWSRWPRPLRWTAYVAVGLVLVLVVAAVVAVALVRRPLPQVDGRLDVAGLQAPVEVLRDEHGIAQLWGSSDVDLVRAQGFVHAQDRFYEMDVRRHATAGRLAELFGEAALPSDRMVRTMGWRVVAEQEVALIAPRTRELFQAYADGVNAYLTDRGTSRIALAYTVLGAGGLDYRPEPWTVADSLAWLKAMAWDLRGNMGDELGRALAVDSVGVERAAQLWPDYPEEHAPIVGGGAVVDGVFEPEATTGGTRLPERAAPYAGEQEVLTSLRDGVAAMPAWLGRGDGIGSNSFVVSGEHTTTGMPLLANDPHLGASVPGVWLQIGLHCVEATPDCTLDVSGFSFSGVPGVIIGHNAEIAWGFTNLGPDVTDLYLERITDGAALHGRRREPLTTRTETLVVAGGDDVEITVRESRHGPILSDAAGAVDDPAADVGVGGLAARSDDAGLGDGEELAVALQWTALTPGTTADAILALDAASDWDDFRAAAADFAVPAQNLVYADTEGHIGYQAPGVVPIRRSGNDGRLPARGWLPEDDWSGDTVPFAGLPSVLDPDEGFVVTANQQVIDPETTGYPYFLTDDWDRGYRSQRIRQRLESAIGRGDGLLDAADLSDVQLDSRQPFATTLLPFLLAADLPAGYYSDGQRVLADWDLDQDADSAGAAYFNVVWSALLARTFHDELPEDLWPDGGQRWFAVVGDLLERPDDPWWDDVDTEGVVETRDEVVRGALVDARDEIRRLSGRDPSGWEWGRLHQLDLREPSLGGSGVGLVERIFNRGGWWASGSSSAVDATSWDAAVGYDVTAAPSMRMVVDLADLDASRWINLTGVSGHPFSGHYTDQTDLWARGETLPWPSTRDAVEAAAEHTLTLVPTDAD